jgi:predicted  nucleic acid-binding Zn-ribbon protein
VKKYEIDPCAKKAFLQDQLARLERVRAPIKEDLEKVNEQIKAVKKKLRRFRNVKAEKSIFLF